MSKPSIIILMHYLELGGAEMALIGLLSALDPEKVDVDLFIYDHRGPLMSFWVSAEHLLKIFYNISCLCGVCLNRLS